MNSLLLLSAGAITCSSAFHPCISIQVEGLQGMSEEKQVEKIWQISKQSREPKFYVPDAPPAKTAEQTEIQRWLDLADRALKTDEDSDPTPSAA